MRLASDTALQADVLESLGFLGSWQVDYASSRFRANDAVGAAFGLAPGQVADGVNLDLLDRSFFPEDLALIDEMRRNFRSSGPGGHCRFRYRLKHPSEDGCIWVEVSQFMTVDRDGLRKTAVGTLTDVTALQLPHAMPKAWQTVMEACGTIDDIPLPASVKLASVDRLAADLVRVCRDARALGLGSVEADLKPALGRVSRLLSGAFRRSTHN